jgi:uncharacterized protein with HEPN domain
MKMTTEIPGAIQLRRSLPAGSVMTSTNDRLLLFGVVHAIEVIGEAAVKVSEETRAAAPGVPWSAIVAMRNRLAHGYFDIDAGIVWQTAVAEVPDILPALRSLIGDMRG